MNSIRQLSDAELLKQITLDAETERKFGLLVIHQLREVARRMLYAKQGFSSLHAYCMEELKYSSGSAWRRIQAMEALKAIPELEEKIQTGALTLSNVSQVQAFCDQNRKTVEEKKTLFEQVEGLSKRATEKKLAEIAPQLEKPEKVRVLTVETSELRVNLSAQTMEHLDQIRGFLAHSHPNASYSEILTLLAQLGVERLNPARLRRGERPQASTQSAGGETSSTRITNGETHVSPALSSGGGSSATRIANNETHAPPVLSAGGRTSPITRTPPHAIPAATRRLIWRRDQGRCSYVSPETGRACLAQGRLQIDHITPRALGGDHRPENLRLLCQKHNLLVATQMLGTQKIGHYLKEKH